MEEKEFQRTKKYIYFPPQIHTDYNMGDTIRCKTSLRYNGGKLRTDLRKGKQDMIKSGRKKGERLT